MPPRKDGRGLARRTAACRGGIGEHSDRADPVTRQEQAFGIRDRDVGATLEPVLRRERKRRSACARIASRSFFTSPFRESSSAI